MGFEHQGWGLHNLSDQRVPVVSHTHNKKVFPDAQREPLVFQFVPIASGPFPSLRNLLLLGREYFCWSGCFISCGHYRRLR